MKKLSDYVISSETENRIYYDARPTEVIEWVTLRLPAPVAEAADAVISAARVISDTEGYPKCDDMLALSQSLAAYDKAVRDEG